MNIFAISSDVHECAHMLDDKRLNKMTLETCQMLSTAIRLHLGKNGWLRRWQWDKYVPYKYCLPYELDKAVYYTQKIDLASYINHPCTVWVRYDWKHFMWTLRLLCAMLDERKVRGFNPTACANRLDTYTQYMMEHIPKGQGLPDYYANCSAFKDKPVFEAYRFTMIKKWNEDSFIPTWTNRGQPEWSIGLIEREDMR